jgi:Leucine-rich repeat (LRR) protein
MESNNLAGSIPAELGSLPALNDLRLNSNNLTGSIPAELGNLSSLATLLLASNELSGVVPLPAAVLGGELQQIDRSRCNLESNPGLSMPDSQDYYGC